MGGVLVNGRCEALNLNEKPIEGLYAAGDTIGGLMGGYRGGYTGGLMQAVVTGILAGENATDHIKLTKIENSGSKIAIFHHGGPSAASRNQSRDISRKGAKTACYHKPFRPSSELTLGEIFLISLPFARAGEKLFLPAAKQIA